jgi:hypothetical protein
VFPTTKYVFCSHGATAPCGQVLPHYRELTITLRQDHRRHDASGHVISLTQTGQQTTVTKDRHACPGGIGTLNPNKRATVDESLRPHDYRDWPSAIFRMEKSTTVRLHRSTKFNFFLSHEETYLILIVLLTLNSNM